MQPTEEDGQIALEVGGSPYRNRSRDRYCDGFYRLP